MKRREVKRKGEKERYKHLNAEFQRIARRDKKTFLSDQCKEIEENNRWERLEISSRKLEIPWKAKEEGNKNNSSKIAKEYDRETTFFPTNSSKDHLNTEQLPENYF